MFMSRKYEALAQGIIKNVGGKENVNDGVSLSDQTAL